MRRTPLAATDRTQPLGLDWLSALLGLGVSVMAFLLLTQYADHNIVMAVKCLFIPVFIYNALLFHRLLLGGFHLSRVSSADMAFSALSGSVTFISLLAVTAVQPLAAFRLEDALFYGSMGIAEEFTFGYLFFAFLLYVTREPVSAAVIDGLLFMVFHFGVYQFDWTALVLAVVARVFFCFAYYVTRNLMAAIGPHVLFNVLASQAGLFIIRV